MRKIFYSTIFLFCSLFATAQTIADIVIGSPDHEVLEAAVIAADLAGTLSGPGNFTVFAPTDAAFAALPMGTVDALLQDPTGDLQKILLHHVLGAEVFSGDLADGQMATTLLGQGITVIINADGVFINNAKVTMVDLDASNGVVHVIDAVILPAATVADIVIASPDHETLEAAVTAAGLVPALQGDGDLTVFAPTDAAFAALPMGTVDALLQDPTGDLAKILLYHVVGGETLAGDLSDGMMAPTLFGPNVTFRIDADGAFINDAKISVTDIRTLNGVVHVIDAVILPTATVADVVIASPNHETLEAAVTAAGLVPALQGDGDLTVFAPTDAAFAALPAGTVDALLQDPMGRLAKILLYHVVGGETLAGDLSDGMMAPTLFGPNVTFRIDADGAFINDAKISVTDIRTLNGVVHVIDAVILPTATVADVVIASPNHETLEAAVTAAGLVPALQGDGDLTVFAPTDAAFAALPAGTVDALLQDPMGRLAKILLYHVVGGETLAGDLSDGMMAPTLFGPNVTFRIDADGAFINDAKISVTDIRTLNGVVHVIDAVILPTATVADVVIASPNHETLEAAVTAAGLVPALQGDGDLTVFAPTDAAFAALPAGTVDALLQDPMGRLAKILLYHVVGGETLAGDLSDGMVAPTLFGPNVTFRIDADGAFINDAKISVTDVRTLNGVVHVIDAVILPTATVVDVVVNSSVHETLEAAVTAAGLVPTLQGDGPFTVFAPTDAAFANLPAGTVDDLLQDPTGDLAKILTYHVLAGEVLSGDLSDGQIAETLFGQDVTVAIDANGVSINGAKVTVADIRTLNGVVHVIDAVLLPNLSSVNDLQEVSVRISPNPTTDFITVDLPEAMISEEAMIYVFSMEGKMVKNQKTIGTQTTVDVSNLSAGTYVLRLISETASAKSTIIIK